MTETTKYKYSINFSFGTIVLMLLLMLLLLSNVIKASSTAAWVIYGICSLLFISLISLLVVKRLIPALKGEIALELNEQGIVDYIRNVTIDWKDIQEITLRRGRSASTMRVVIKWESDYGKEIWIPLRWIKGKDADIYNTVLAYFEEQETTG
jgi:hypothetical protein